MRRVARLVLLVALVSAFSLACHRGPHERATVAVSVFPVYDLVRRIAGPDADVALVLPPGSSPAHWSPSPEAAAAVAHAKLVVTVGAGLDPWMDALVAQAGPKTKTLRLADRVPTLTSGDGTLESYVWMDPQRARLLATAIAEDLARADSSHAIVFGERASAVDRSLAALDKEIEARLASAPKRDALTVPPTLAYFADRYGLATGASATPLDASLDALGGTDGKTTYEDLIRFDTAALESRWR